MLESRQIVFAFFNLGGYHVARLEAAAAALQPSGWQVTALELSPHDSQRPWGKIAPAGDFHRIRVYESAEAFEQGVGETLERRINEILVRIDPTVLIVPGWGFEISRLMLAWGRRHARRVIVMSESKFDDQRRNPVVEFVKSWRFVRRYDAALVGGKQHADYLIRLGMRCDRIFFGYDVVDNAHFKMGAEAARRSPEQVRRKLPFLPQKDYFLAATRFIPRKNLAFLVDAYACYRETAGDKALDLVLLGSGELSDALCKQVEKRGLSSHVLMPGFLAYDQMPMVYGLARAFVHPALVEQWGLVINEALASGVPVISSRTVGAAEMINPGDQGWLIDPKTSEDLHRALLEAHRLSPEAQAELREKCYTRAAEYAPETFGQGVVNAMRALSLV